MMWLTCVSSSWNPAKFCDWPVPRTTAKGLCSPHLAGVDPMTEVKCVDIGFARCNLNDAQNQYNCTWNYVLPHFDSFGVIECEACLWTDKERRWWSQPFVTLIMYQGSDDLDPCFIADWQSWCWLMFFRCCRTFQSMCNTLRSFVSPRQYLEHEGRLITHGSIQFQAEFGGVHVLVLARSTVYHCLPVMWGEFRIWVQVRFRAKHPSWHCCKMRLVW